MTRSVLTIQQATIPQLLILYTLARGSSSYRTMYAVTVLRVLERCGMTEGICTGGGHSGYVRNLSKFWKRSANGKITSYVIVGCYYYWWSDSDIRTPTGM